MVSLLNFYYVHYNFFAVTILLVFLGLFFISKKNYKGLIVALVLTVAFNVFLNSKTSGKAWERQFLASDETPKAILLYDNIVNDSLKVRTDFRDSMKVVFDTKAIPGHNWVVYAQVPNSKEVKILHWCWWDDAWEVFSQTDLVAYLWGENSGKKIRGSSEKRMDDAMNLR